MPAGNYLVEVDGVGNLDNENSDYGSLGPYTVHVAGCTAAAASAFPLRPADLVADDVPSAWSTDLSWRAPTPSVGPR